jgi:hypothetical protein
MSSNNWTFDEAYNLIKVVRPSADINAGFESQLRAYAAANYDVYIAQQLLLRTRIRDLYLLRDTSNRDGQFSKPSSTISIDTNFVEAKPPRSNSRQKRALSDAKEPLAELLTDIPYHSPIDKDGCGSAVTDGCYSVSSNCSSLSGCRDVVGKKFGNRSMDIDTSTELEDSMTSCSSDLKIPFKSPFNSNATMTTQSTCTTNSSFSLTSNRNTIGMSTDPMSITSEQGHVSSGDSSCGSDNMLDESMDSLFSIGSNVSFEQLSKGPLLMDRPKGNKSHRTTKETSASGNIQYQYFQSESKNLAIHPANESNPSNKPSMENPVTETKYPTCKLSRPMSNWIRIIPPLMGLEREFKCSWCNKSLFQLANVIRVDIENIQIMLESYQQSMKLLIARGSTYSKMKRDFDDVIPQDELEEAFIQQNSHNLMLNTTPEYCPNLSIHRETSALDYTTQSFLPPITKKNSQKPFGGFSAGFSASGHSVDLVSSYGAMEVDEEFTKPFAPLKTCRANSRSNRGFTFESSSVDDNDASSSSGAKASSGISKNSFRTPFKDSCGVADDKNESLTQTYPSLSISRSFSSIQKVSGTSPLDSAATKQSVRTLPAIQNQTSPPTSQEKVQKKVLGLNTNQPYNNTSIPAMYSGGASAMCPPLYDESPRVSIPPHKLHPENNFASVSSRPSSANANGTTKSQSAEKRRWLARLNLLRESNVESSNNSNKNIKNKIANISEADDLATQHYFNDPTEKYFYVEYLPWMGGEIFHYPKDHGEICCPGCSRVVGSWSWNPSARYIICIHFRFDIVS